MEMLRNVILLCSVVAVLCQRTHQGVTWDQGLVDSIPKVFTDEADKVFIEKAHKLKVVAIQQGCSMYDKRLLILEDGTKVCCKHRVNYQQLQGELYSFHLSRMLHIYNVPPTLLVKVDYRNSQWRDVVGDINKAGLKHGMVVVFTQYVENLRPTYIPKMLDINNNLILPSNISLRMTTERTVQQLIQWTNLIVFDYVTANSDRVMNALSNLQWNPKVITMPVHNLEETPQGSIVFIDNESGFWLGYKLASESENYNKLQKSYITKICIVDGTVLRTMGELLNVGVGELQKRVVEYDPASCQLIPMIRDNIIYELENRLTFAINSINSCSKNA